MKNIIAKVQAHTKGTKIVSIRSVTKPRMRKTNNPFFDRILKVTDQTLMIGSDYKKACDKGLAKIGEANPDYKVKESWHKHYNGHSAIVTDTKTETKFYLYGRRLNNPKTGKLQSKSRYIYKMDNGNFCFIDKKVFEKFLYESKPSAFKPIVATIEFKNIVSIKFDGEKIYNPLIERLKVNKVKMIVDNEDDTKRISSKEGDVKMVS